MYKEISIDNVEVFGIRASLRGMRNPLNSWDRSDTVVAKNNEGAIIGPRDMDLAQRLINAGSEHSKFLRFITVTFDIELPLYVWKEFDTYKFCEKNSCSTMHKITSRPLTMDDFRIDNPDEHDHETLRILNLLIKEYKATPAEESAIRNIIFRKIIQKLPSSFLQKRTVITNYAELRNMYHQRKNHKLEEWLQICAWISKLPYESFMVE